ncbi:hypothetical protein HHI36_019612 [Cryptolaemus montrouzieri]|uniref:EF-hand domain-containing protein n=1 Tax=Cryptolaemus montrouzieri TaxID=559131 RepID=A0ABD2N8H2_9CUCU
MSTSQFEELLCSVALHITKHYVVQDVINPEERLILTLRFQPASAEKLLEAFRVLDIEGKKFLTKEELTTLMTERGEPLQPDELEEMIQVSVDPETDNIPYEVYINEIMGIIIHHNSSQVAMNGKTYFYFQGIDVKLWRYCDT